MSGRRHVRPTAAPTTSASAPSSVYLVQKTWHRVGAMLETRSGRLILSQRVR